MGVGDFFSDVGRRLGITGGTGTSAPGVGGPRGTGGGGSPFYYDQATGLYYDPNTGTSYSDPGGNYPVTNPNVAQQVAANFKTAHGFLGDLSGMEAERRAAAGDMSALSQLLTRQVQGQGPSVAGTQAAIGLGQIANQQLSGAAGVGGAAGPLAQMLAQRNIARAQIGANQAATLGRVQEQLGAESALANVLNARANSASTAYGQTGQLGLGYSNLAEGGQEAQQGLIGKETDRQDKRFSDTLGGAGDVASYAFLASDRRVKKGIKPEGKRSLGAFLSSLSPKSYRYKGEKDKRHGIVVQDMERSKIGRDLVRKVGGVKVIPVAQGLGAALASLGSLHKRVADLEAA